MSKNSDADEEFQAIAQEVLHFALQMYPSWGTSLGLHEYDSLMPDGSREIQLRSIEKLKEFRKGFESLDESELSEGNRMDRLIALGDLDLHIFHMDELRRWECTPSGIGVVGEHIFSLYVRDFAPMGIRFRNIKNRLSATPKYLEQSKSLVTDPVKIWTEIQIESADRFPDFLGLVSSTAEKALDKVHFAELKEAISNTMQAIEDYTSWMKDILQKAREDFAMGRENLQKQLKLSSIDMHVEDIYELGKQYLAKEKKKANDIAQRIKPEASLENVKEFVKSKHPDDFKRVMGLYRDSVSEVRDFVVNNEIATMPPSESLKVIETPAYLRHIIPHAAYFSPGKFERDQQGIYLVTPVEDKKEMLKEHCYADIGNTSVHEAYPGHHLQLVCSNSNPSLVRAMVGANETIEGWAHYCEDMMKEHGYEDNPEARFMQSIDLIWRAARIIVDIDFSSGKMSFDEAVKFLRDEVGMEEPFAVAEVKRYTRAQGYQLCYLLGKHLIMELRDDIRKRMGSEFSERFFHDTILYAGSIPVKFLRMEFDRRLKEMGL